jgi:hypothetical protein
MPLPSDTATHGNSSRALTGPPELTGPGANTLRRRLDQLDTAINDYARQEKLIA